MKATDHNKAWDILIERQGERKENRTAFIAALLMERCTRLTAPDRDNDGQPVAALTAFQASTYAAEFVRLARAIHGLAVADCNYGLSKGQETRKERLQTRFTALAEALGFEARTGGDPRGACAYLIDPDDRKGDGWGEGFAVYS